MPERSVNACAGENAARFGTRIGKRAQLGAYGNGGGAAGCERCWNARRKMRARQTATGITARYQNAAGGLYGKWASRSYMKREPRTFTVPQRRRWESCGEEYGVPDCGPRAHWRRAEIRRKDIAESAGIVTGGVNSVRG